MVTARKKKPCSGPPKLLFLTATLHKTFISGSTNDLQSLHFLNQCSVKARGIILNLTKVSVLLKLSEQNHWNLAEDMQNSSLLSLGVKNRNKNNYDSPYILSAYHIPGTVPNRLNALYNVVLSLTKEVLIYLFAQKC